MSAPALDVPRLADAMRARGLAVTGRLSLSRVGFGLSNLTYVAEDAAGRRRVVRRPPLGQLLVSAHDVEREARILAALGATEVPVPEVYCSLAAGEVADVPVVVMEYVDGHVIDGFEAVGRLPSAVRAPLVADLARVLAAIHRVELVDVGLHDLASHGPYAERQLRRWSAQWGRSRTRELPALEAMTELLRRKAPPQERTCLLHGDFSPRNLIVDPDLGAVRTVLDWELSTLGEPLADVGAVLAYWTVADATLARSGTPVAESSEPDRRQLVRRYLAAAGGDEGDVAYWHALGLWKLAVITEGVIRRAVDDPGNIAATGVPDPVDVDHLIELATVVAEAAGLT